MYSLFYSNLANVIFVSFAVKLTMIIPSIVPFKVITVSRVFFPLIRWYTERKYTFWHACGEYCEFGPLENCYFVCVFVCLFVRGMLLIAQPNCSHQIAEIVN